MTTVNVDAPTSTTVATSSALDALVGPGKKFDSPESLAKGKLESDSFIASLTNENKELRGLVSSQDMRLSQMEARLSILDRLNENPTHTAVTPPVNQTTVTHVEPQRVGLSEEDVLRVVEQAKVNESAARNKAEVDSALAKMFGAEAGAFLLQKAGELGVNAQVLKNLALTSPKAFFNTLGINPNAKPNNTTYVGGRAQNAMTTGEPIRNNAYYEGLKKQMGAKAFVLDKNLQLARHRDMEQLGDAWDVA